MSATAVSRRLGAGVRNGHAAVVRLEHVWVLATLAAAFAAPASAPVSLVDLAWTLKSGEWIVAHQRLPDIDPFTTAPQVPQPHDTQWLAQLVYYGLFRAGGLELVSLGTALAVAAAFGLVLLACRAAGGGLKLSCACTLAAFGLAVTNIDSRPQTLAYPLFGLFLLVLARARQNGHLGRLAWLLPLTMLVWANIHGSFVLGLGLVVLAGLGSAVEARSASAARAYGCLLAACGAAACVTPYGPGSLRSVVELSANPVIRQNVTEWMPTSVASGPSGLGVLFFVSLAALGAVILGSPGRPRVADWLALAAFAALGLWAVRGIAWWGMIAAPIAASLGSAGLRSRPRSGGTTARERPALNALLAAGILSLAIVSLPWFKQANPLLPEAKRARLAPDTPVAVAAYLREHEYPGLMLNHVNWGAYLEWALWPGQQPFLDDRFELHPVEVWDDYASVVSVRAGWEETLDRYGIGYLVLSQQAQPLLVEAADQSTRWESVYRDEQAAVFVRRAPL